MIKIISILVLIVWLMALGRTLINLAVVPRLRRVSEPPRSPPLVSVVIPARDEERTIARTLQSFLSQSWPNLEVVVVNDRSADQTGAILGALAAIDRRLVVVTGEEPPAGWLGKPWALHQGSLRARGEWLLFADADVIYSPDAIAAAVTSLDESDTAMLSLFPHLEMRGFWEHVAMPYLAFVAFTVLPLWLVNRTRIRILAIGGGTGNLIRRDAYAHAGGHEELRDSVIDDVALARLIRRRGGRTSVARADHLISIRMYHGSREIVDGFTKNAFAVVNRNYLFAVIATVATIVFHLLPYGFALAGDVVSIVTVLVISLTRLLLFHSLGYRLDSALFGHPLMMVLWLYISLRSVWYTGIRRQIRWRGRTYDARNTRFGAD